MSITATYKIVDKNTEAAVKAVEKYAIEGKNGNYEIVQKTLTPNDLSKMTEGKRYIDRDNHNKPFIKYRIGQKVYKQTLSEYSETAETTDIIADTTAYVSDSLTGYKEIKDKNITGDYSGLGTTSYEGYYFKGVEFIFDIGSLEFINCKFRDCYIKNTGAVLFDSDCIGGMVMTTGDTFLPGRIQGWTGLDYDSF